MRGNSQPAREEPAVHNRSGRKIIAAARAFITVADRNAKRIDDAIAALPEDTSEEEKMHVAATTLQENLGKYFAALQKAVHEGEEDKPVLIALQ